jgi:hypothetical protein
LDLIVYSSQPLDLILYLAQHLTLISLDPISSSTFNYIQSILYLPRLLISKVWKLVLFYISELEGFTGGLVCVIIGFELIFYFLY